MMRLNLDNVNTLLSIDMSSTNPVSGNSAEYERFEAHLRHAERAVDEPLRARSGRPSMAERSKKERSPESRDSSRERIDKRTGTSRRSNDGIDRSEESRAREDAELDVANAEAEQQRADEDGYEEEEVVDEAVVGVAIPEEIVSTVITIGGNSSEESVAEQETEVTAPIGGAKIGAPVLPGEDGQLGSNDAGGNAMAPAEVRAEQALEGAVTAGTSGEEEQSGKTMAASEGELAPDAAGVSLSVLGADGHGLSGEEGASEQTELGALSEAAQLRKGARRQTDRHERGQAKYDAPNQTVPTVDNQPSSTSTASMLQNAGTDAGMVAVPAQPDTVNTGTATTPKGADGEVGAVRAMTSDATQRSASSATSEKTRGSEQAERVRFVQRVARAFESMGDRNGTIRLALHPAELGSLKLHLSVRNGTMEARVEVETENARNLLVENLPALRERLADQNIKVERFDVEFMNRSAGGSSQDAGQQSQSQFQEQARRGERPFQLPGDRKQNTAAEAPAATRRVKLGGLDIFI